MANIKFSQFTVGNTESDIDFVVGYKGANNIQISPANLLSSTLAGYLPLAGGTMTGTSGIHMPDNFALKAGNSQDLQIYHGGVDSYIVNETGNLQLIQKANDKDIQFFSDDGSGGFTEYFRLDGSLATGGTVYTVFSDNSRATFGNGYDLQIYHDTSNSYIKQGAGGHLIIQQETNDGDIAFKCDDGSGGIATYMTIDGGVEMTTFSKDTRHNDSVKGRFGSGGDLYIEHDGTNSKIINTNGDLSITNQADDKDIIFQADDGSGGVTEYFRLDGSVAGFTTFPDGTTLAVGTDRDLRITHDGTTTNIFGVTGDMVFTNFADDKDITFRSDDGSGGVATYFYLDGSSTQVKYDVNLKIHDSKKLIIGDGDDLQIYHNATDSVIENNVGDLYITNKQDDGDIVFRSDDGSGGFTTYFFLDGSSVTTQFYKTIKLYDSAQLWLGDGNDLRIYHNGTNSNIENFTGTLQIIQNLDDGDISFKSDDGSGGLAEYFRLDGGDARTIVSREFRFLDGVASKYGNSGDLEIYHDGTNTRIQNYTGALKIINNTDDGDIEFFCDDGSGGLTEYFRLDGSAEQNVVSKNMRFEDNIQAQFGAGTDLRIYHDGSDSYIKDSGTGVLAILSNDTRIQNSLGNENCARFIENGSVELYHNNNKKFETKSTGINISGVSEYADNTAAIAGGLTTGDVYRTGDLLKIVH